MKQQILDTSQREQEVFGCPTPQPQTAMSFNHGAEFGTVVAAITTKKQQEVFYLS